MITIGHVLERLMLCKVLPCISHTDCSWSKELGDAGKSILHTASNNQAADQHTVLSWLFTHTG